jgi:hypothetical protein
MPDRWGNDMTRHVDRLFLLDGECLRVASIVAFVPPLWNSAPRRATSRS